MSIEENKAIARRYFDELMTGGDLTIADEILGDEVISNGKPLSRESYKQLASVLHQAFPDWSNEIEDQIVADNKVVNRVTSRGTHRSAYMGIAPTGRRAERPGVFIFRFDGGRIVEIWDVIDQLGFLRQLGANVNATQSTTAS